MCSVHGLNIKKITFGYQNIIYCALFMAWLPLPSVSQAVPQPSYWLTFYDISIILFHFLCCCPHIYPHHLCLMSLSSYISPLKYIVFSWIPFLMKFWQNISFSFLSITSSLICLCLHLLDFKQTLSFKSTFLFQSHHCHFLTFSSRPQSCCCHWTCLTFPFAANVFTFLILGFLNYRDNINMK